MFKKLKDKRLLNKIAKVLLRKRAWNSDPCVIEFGKKGILLLWVLYFIIQFIKTNTLFNNLVTYVIDFLEKYSFLKNFSSLPKPIGVLLVLTIAYIGSNIIFFIAKKILKIECVAKRCSTLSRMFRYRSYIEEVITGEILGDFNLNSKTIYAEEDLAEFLNKKSSFGYNIYWLDAPWGYGKTTFIHNFFERQWLKHDEIYYVSCFGIRTREQAEKALLAEIEQHSSFSFLENIPIINGLVKMVFKLLGLNLMKKNAVVIFDDLERVIYSKTGEDDPQEYNDLLGFIDFIANHHNIKVIIAYNSEELERTCKCIINDKFKPVVKKFSPFKQTIPAIIESYPFTGEKVHLKEFLKEIFVLLLKNYDPFNLRVLTHFLDETKFLDFFEVIVYMIKENTLNLSNQAYDDNIMGNLALQPIRYSLLMLEMNQNVKNSRCKKYKVYGRGYIENSTDSKDYFDYTDLYELIMRDEELLSENSEYKELLSKNNKSTEGILLQLYDGQEGLSVRKLEFTVGNLVFMFNFLHPKQVLNEVSLAEHMKNHFKVVAVPPAPNPTVVHNLTDDFQTVFQSFSQKNALHQVKHLEAWQSVLLELKVDLEQDEYYNFLKHEKLNWPITSDRTYFDNMPKGMFSELDDYRKRIEGF